LAGGIEPHGDTILFMLKAEGLCHSNLRVIDRPADGKEVLAGYGLDLKDVIRR